MVRPGKVETVICLCEKVQFLTGQHWATGVYMKERHDLRWHLTYWSLLALRHDAVNTGVFRGARPSDRGDNHPGYRTSIRLMRQGQER